MRAQKTVPGIGRALEILNANQRIVARPQRDPRAQRIGLQFELLGESAGTHGSADVLCRLDSCRIERFQPSFCALSISATSSLGYRRLGVMA